GSSLRGTRWACRHRGFPASASLLRRVSTQRRPPRVSPRGAHRPTAGLYRASTRLHFVLPPILRTVQTLPGSRFSILGAPVRPPARREQTSDSAPVRPTGTRRLLRPCCQWPSPVAPTFQIAPTRLYLTHSFESGLYGNISACGWFRMPGRYRRVQNRRRAQVQALLPNALLCLREAENATSGLGSSHTTPCGAAVPARPPTRP